MNLLIIADDLSGAADCAIGFASVGLPTVVTLDPSRDTGAAQVIAADTDSRRLAPEAAAQRAVSTFKTLLRPGQRLYKKIDSTLRGNWAAEVAALQSLAGLAIVAPAFPATGRTTQDGRVWVNGQPLESTDTWQLEHAGRCADIDGLLAEAGLRTAPLKLEVLRGDVQALAEHIHAAARSGVQALIVDAQTAQDLRILARVTLELDQPLYWVGSGGLAREIAQLAGLSDALTEGLPAAAQAPILALVGSLSEVCQRQCALLKARADIDELIVPPEVLRQGAQHARWDNWQMDIGKVLEQGRDLLLRIGRDDAFDPAEGVQLSEQLAVMVAPHFSKLGGLVATGGETARAMLGAVGIGSLQLLAEVEAGVAFGRPVTNGHCPGIVTKAGAFGTDHALYAAWLHLHGLSEPLAVANI
jgi:uncharacterized protein YgbK (DUF1537 family)